MAEYTRVPTEEPAQEMQPVATAGVQAPSGQVFVLVPVSYAPETPVVMKSAQDEDEELFFGLRPRETDVLSWLLCIGGYFFFFPWICGMVCMRARSRAARAGGFTSAVCLLLSLIALLVMLVLILVNPPHARSLRHH